VRDGKLVGHNTDGSGWAWGFTRALPHADLSHVVLLGAGGAGAAIAHAVLRLGAQQLSIVDAQPERAAQLAADVNALYGARAHAADLSAAMAQASAQYRPGRYGNQGYGNQGYYPAQMRVTAITEVKRQRNGVRVSGLLDSQSGYQPPYGQAYGYQGQRYAGQADLSFRCNVDYVTGAAWGMHDNFMHQADPRLLPKQMIPHLVSRIVYTGAGGFVFGSPCAGRAGHGNRPRDRTGASARARSHSDERCTGAARVPVRRTRPRRSRHRRLQAGRNGRRLPGPDGRPGPRALRRGRARPRRLRVWRAWAHDLRGQAIDCGHHIAEERPKALAQALRGFFAGA